MDRDDNKKIIEAFCKDHKLVLEVCVFAVVHIVWIRGGLKEKEIIEKQLIPSIKGNCSLVWVEGGYVKFNIRYG